MTQLLSSVGFEVREASNGQEALETWLDWKPDLIFMDMQMPIIDGYTATRNIRVYQQGEATIILALTAHAFEEYRQYILSIGCDDLIRKPFQQKELFATISKYLNIQYRYEEEPLTSPKNHSKNLNNSQSNFVLNAISLDVRLREWVEQLYVYSAQCSDFSLNCMIKKIPTQYSDLAQALTDILDKFRYDQIVELTQSIINKPVSKN
ncbi:response regulator [Lyngbya aestuarii BL J]|uniref:Response regulator n=1 Tax=Lyngbya aestuarii BL J TaxID=1348334 RepID=U7QFE2_9CYAN|nr:response regulator [Lyngbya aestuarii]ERT06623.1 response regulator [Lyngbya aestuarii BL J]